MASKYKIGGKAILTDSDGTRDLIAESVVYEESFTATNTIRSLAPDYFTDYFPPSNPFQGEVSGYASGGKFPQFTSHNNIDKFPFSTDANATDVGDLTRNAAEITGQSSSSNGYSTGPNIIDKFPFASDGNATDVGDLTQTRVGPTGNSSQTVGFGYSSGGDINPGGSSNTIDKFPFSADANATDVGDLTNTREDQSGQSSAENGYISGKFPPFSPTTQNINKFPFASDANATNIGEQTAGRDRSAGQSSDVSGYTSGGATGSNKTNIIDKFPFSTDTNATDVGDLVTARSWISEQSSFTNGYASGGYFAPPYNGENRIEKFPFASDTNATDVGDLVANRHAQAGQQV